MNPMQGPLCTCRVIADKGLFSIVVLPSVCYRCYASPSMIFCYQGRKCRGMLRRYRVCASPIAEAQTPAGTFFLGPVWEAELLRKWGVKEHFPKPGKISTIQLYVPPGRDPASQQQHP